MYLKSLFSLFLLLLIHSVSCSQPLLAQSSRRFKAEDFSGIYSNKLIAQALGSSQMRKAISLFNTGKYTDAVSVFSRIISSPTVNRVTKNKALIARAQAFIVIGQPALALLDLNKIVYSDNESKRVAELHLIRGTTYIQLKDYKSALTELSKSLAIVPNDASVYANRAVAYQALGDLNSASSDLNKSLDIDPIPSTIYNLAVLEKLRSNYKKCYFLLSKLVDADAAYVDVFIQKALCAESLGYQDEALKDYLKAASLDNMNPMVLEKIGIIVAAAGDPSSASKYLERASEIYLTKGLIQEYTKVVEILESLRN